ncbi:MAG: fibronectin type III domain-containing protein, partial [Kiritimatiellia bacterium]
MGWTSKSLGWLGFAPLLWAVAAGGQAYRTPARASWTEDPATTATITWDRPEAGRGMVRYGTTTHFTHLERDGGGTHLHAIPVRGLEPGTRYYYEASSTDGYAQPGTFRTAPAAGQPLHFVFHGDLQGGIDETGARGVAAQIAAEDPPFVVSLGDMAEEAFSDSGFETWDVFFRICSNELAQAVYMPIMGNHDAAPGSDVTRGLYQRLFSLPEPSLGNGTYSFAVGNVRFISLNTEVDAGAQNDWLARELQAAANDPAAVWTIALCHRPPYSNGERAGDDHYNTNRIPLLT